MDQSVLGKELSNHRQYIVVRVLPGVVGSLAGVAVLAEAAAVTDGSTLIKVASEGSTSEEVSAVGGDNSAGFEMDGRRR